jgi:hypothetical protein
MGADSFSRERVSYVAARPEQALIAISQTRWDSHIARG